MFPELFADIFILSSCDVSVEQSDESSLISLSLHESSQLSCWLTVHSFDLFCEF